MKCALLAFLAFATAFAPAFATGAEKGNPGPWGDYTYTRIFLEAPEGSLEQFPVPSNKTIWRFPGKSLTETVTFLQTTLASDEGVRVTPEDLGLQELEEETRAFPSLDLIRAISPENRRTLYSHLAQHRENPFHHQPVFLHTDSARDWYRLERLPEAALSLVDGLAYPVGSSLAFSDVPALLSLATSDAEEASLWKAMTRSYTMIVELQFREDSSFEELRNYWTADGKFQSAISVFDSFTRDRGESSFDLNQLLPPVPRKYFHTFPTARAGASGMYPNSLWTSVNFFAFLPDPAFVEWEEVKPYLEHRYERKQDPFRYGDILLFRRAGIDRPVHACVYLADDFVYTKNGVSIIEPWVIMKLNHVLDRFSVPGTPDLEAWRRSAPVSSNRTL